jgi:hypothetical protein
MARTPHLIQRIITLESLLFPMPLSLHFSRVFIDELVGFYNAVLPDMDAKHILLEAPGSQGTAIQSWDLSSALAATQHIQFFYTDVY